MKTNIADYLPRMPITIDERTGSFLDTVVEELGKVRSNGITPDFIEAVDVKGSKVKVYLTQRIVDEYSQLPQVDLDGRVWYGSDPRGYCILEHDLDSATGATTRTVFPDLTCIYHAWMGFARLFTLGLFEFLPSERKNRRQKNEFNRDVRNIKVRNLSSIHDAVDGILIDQGDEVEFAGHYGSVERVKTGTSETFLRCANDFALRIRAYLLGANALVHYTRGSSEATPVRYTPKNAEPSGTQA
jgi:hypothetical protein